MIGWIVGGLFVVLVFVIILAANARSGQMSNEEEHFNSEAPHGTEEAN